MPTGNRATEAVAICRGMLRLLGLCAPREALPANGGFVDEVAGTFKRSLVDNRADARTVVAWMGANEKTVKPWLAGRCGRDRLVAIHTRSSREQQGPSHHSHGLDRVRGDQPINPTPHASNRTSLKQFGRHGERSLPDPSPPPSSLLRTRTGAYRGAEIVVFSKGFASPMRTS